MNVAPPTELQRAAAQEVLRRRHALESLEVFREYMAPCGSVDFMHAPARHHKLIMSALERLDRGEIMRLLILAPPGSAKSTYCSIQYPMQRLAKRPHENILCASNTQGLAENFNRRRRNIALSPQWQTLSGTALADDLQGVEHFGTKKQGGVRAAGVGSGIVGFRSHLNILDDPISGIEEALSAPALDKQWDWYHNEFRTRLVPHGRELIVSTRWAKKDIAGRILATEPEKWTVLRLPMIADREDDPLGRVLGEPLWPGYFGPAFIEEKQKNVLLWSTQFQQTPLDESGIWVGLENITHIDARPPGDSHRIIAVDLALSVGRGDYTVFVVAQMDPDRRVHIIHVERSRVGPDASVDKLFELAFAFRPMEVLIDDDNASKVFKTAVFERMRSAREGHAPFVLHALPMRGKDKETRAAAIRALFLRGDVRILKASWTAALVAELLEFPSGDHDDQVDALGLIGRRLPMLSAPEKQRLTRGPYEGYLTRPREGGGYETQIGLSQMFEDRERTLRRVRNRT